MGFWELLEVSSMPVLQVMLVGLVGAFLASGYSNALHADARKHMNRVVFLAFTPSLMFASLAKTVTLKDIISWWFMLVNIGLIFLIGGTLGWVVVKVLRPERHLEGLVVATCAAAQVLRDGRELLGRRVLRDRHPPRLFTFDATISSFSCHRSCWEFNPCGYTFLVEKSNFAFDVSDILSAQSCVWAVLYFSDEPKHV